MKARDNTGKKEEHSRDDMSVAQKRREDERRDTRIS